MSRIQRDSVGPRQRIKLEGSMSTIIIDGDVGESAHVLVNGSMGQIHVGGYIHANARVAVIGSMGKIFHHGMHETASVECNGSMGQVINQGTPKDPPDRSGLEFGTGWHVGDGLFGNLFSSSSYESVQYSGPKTPKRKRPDKAKPVADDHDAVTIQKSARPREQWGT